MTWPPCWVAMLQIRWGAAMQNLVPNARDRASDPKNKRGAHLIGRSEGRRHKRQLTGPQEPAAAPAVGEDGVTLPVAANLATPAPGDPSTTWDGRDAPSALGPGALATPCPPTAVRNVLGPGWAGPCGGTGARKRPCHGACWDATPPTVMAPCSFFVRSPDSQTMNDQPLPPRGPTCQKRTLRGQAEHLRIVSHQ